jgi:hypothetical protein
VACRWAIRPSGAPLDWAGGCREPAVGWELQLAVADSAEGYAWAISARDTLDTWYDRFRSFQVSSSRIWAKGLEGLDQLRQDLVHVTDDAEVGDPKIGASLSLLMAMMFFEPFMPTMLRGAEMAAMYSFGLTTCRSGRPGAVGHPAASTMARGTGRAEQLGQLLTISYLLLAQPVSTGDDDVGPVELGPWVSPTCVATIFAPPATPSSGTGALTTPERHRRGFRGSSGRNTARNGLSPVKDVVTSVLPPKIGS